MLNFHEFWQRVDVYIRNIKHILGVYFLCACVCVCVTLPETQEITRIRQSYLVSINVSQQAESVSVPWSHCTTVPALLLSKRATWKHPHTEKTVTAPACSCYKGGGRDALRVMGSARVRGSQGPVASMGCRPRQCKVHF